MLTLGKLGTANGLVSGPRSASACGSSAEGQSAAGVSAAGMSASGRSDAGASAAGRSAGGRPAGGRSAAGRSAPVPGTASAGGISALGRVIAAGSAIMPLLRAACLLASRIGRSGAVGSAGAPPSSAPSETRAFGISTIGRGAAVDGRLQSDPDVVPLGELAGDEQAEPVAVGQVELRRVGEVAVDLRQPVCARCRGRGPRSRRRIPGRPRRPGSARACWAESTTVAFSASSAIRWMTSATACPATAARVRASTLILV